jgi:S-adenosylmethionine synthetase
MYSFIPPSLPPSFHSCIQRDLNLKRPIMTKTAAYGHFGRNDPDFTWEQVKTLEL